MVEVNKGETVPIFVSAGSSPVAAGSSSQSPDFSQLWVPIIVSAGAASTSGNGAVGSESVNAGTGEAPAARADVAGTAANSATTSSGTSGSTSNTGTTDASTAGSAQSSGTTGSNASKSTGSTGTAGASAGSHTTTAAAACRFMQQSSDLLNFVGLGAITQVSWAFRAASWSVKMVYSLWGDFCKGFDGEKIKFSAGRDWVVATLNKIQTWFRSRLSDRGGGGNSGTTASRGSATTS